MKCQRCLERESRYRALSDLMDIAVCAACAQEARRLGITVAAVDQDSRAVDQRQHHVVCGDELMSLRTGGQKTIDFKRL